MPTYVYEIMTPGGEPSGETFEVFQSIKAEPLKTHPETGRPVRRVILAPMIGGKNTTFTKQGAANQDKRLGELGFTKYQRAGDGTYEKKAGEGPRVISSGD